MKTISERKIRFLYRWNMIDLRLKSGWEKRIKLGEGVDPNYTASRNLSEIFILRIFLPIVIFLILTLVSSSKSSAVNTFLLSIYLVIVIVIHIIMRSDFAQDLNRLNKLLMKHWDKRRQIFFIKDQIPNYTKLSNIVLSDLGRDLEQAETEYGVESPIAAKIRLEFKAAHATFLKFDICEEHQGAYLPRNKPAAAVA